MAGKSPGCPRGGPADARLCNQSACNGLPWTKLASPHKEKFTASGCAEGCRNMCFRGISGRVHMCPCDVQWCLQVECPTESFFLSGRGTREMEPTTAESRCSCEVLAAFVGAFFCISVTSAGLEGAQHHSDTCLFFFPSDSP